MVEVPFWFAVLAIGVNAIGFALAALCLCANKYPRKPEITAGIDLWRLALCGIFGFMWLWWIGK
jgi:hypothetical protein